ncbi:aldo/keto reductase [Streptomyces sp. NPDC002122]|uniref:aldo/keto reductase n=1 Tax=Streptomyces sp. NPDC002122 TaxID=3154407 RepID=UPI0033293C45
MGYTTFGRLTGLRVSAYALGTANSGTGWGAGAEPDEARRIFDRFAEAGGTFLDNADGYQFGESEELTGKLISADRDHFVPGHQVRPVLRSAAGHLQDGQQPQEHGRLGGGQPEAPGHRLHRPAVGVLP